MLRAILLHHSSNEDHIRPILILTDGSQGFELEPKDAVVKGLMSVNGKMFIANVDADRMGIHGHRLVINEDNSIEKVSFKTFIFLKGFLDIFLPIHTKAFQLALKGLAEMGGSKGTQGK